MGFNQDEPADPVVVPPNAFFAIWSVILLGCLAVAAWGFPLRRAATSPWRQVQLPLALTQFAFVLWLIAARWAPLLTVPIFVVMLALLVRSLRTVGASDRDRVTKRLLGGTLGLYAGWTAAAVWINAATLLPVSVRDSSSLGAMVVFGAILLGAIITAVGLTRVLSGQAAFVVAAGWALLGVTISTATGGAAALSALAAAGLVGIAAATWGSTRHSGAG